MPLFENAVKVRRRRWGILSDVKQTLTLICQRRRKRFVSVVGQRYLVSISLSGTTAIGKYLVNIQNAELNQPRRWTTWLNGATHDGGIMLSKKASLSSYS